MSDLTTDVIIVGGGGCGLSLSGFLSKLQVPHMLFERHGSTSNLPKSHLLNQRTMEIYRQYSMDGPITAAASTEKYVARVRWMTSLAGEEDFEGKELASVKAFGAGEKVEDESNYSYGKFSPMLLRNLPQIRLEPILREIAEERNPHNVLFSHDVVDVEQDDISVTATVAVAGAGGRTLKVRSKFLVAADGGRSIGPKVGLKLDGIGGFANIVTTHFKADLSPHWQDQDFLVNLHGVHGDGGLAPMGPTWGRFSEEWVIHKTYSHKEEPETEKTLVIDAIRKLIGLPGLPIEILYISKWKPERLLADAWRAGRIFIAGDAAHKHPPTGGLGLNGGIQDSHNLAWKLALVLRNAATDKLLETYQMERRQAAQRNCDWAMMTFVNREVLNVAIGVSKHDMMRNAWRLSVLLDDSESGIASRSLLQRIIDTQDTEFSAHDIEMNHIYSRGALIADGSPAPKPDATGQTYTPSTRPGHRLPHAWIRSRDNSKPPRISTHDLIGATGKFLVITDAEGLTWIADIVAAADYIGFEVEVVTIDKKHTRNHRSYLDDQGQWQTVSELSNGGAIIVRPDNVIAWRSRTILNSRTALKRELGQLVGREGKPARM